MNDLKWFLLFVSCVTVLIGGFFIIITVKDQSVVLIGIIVAGIGGFLALISCCMTIKRLAGINQLPRIRFNIEWQNPATNNQQTYQLPVLPQNSQV